MPVELWHSDIETAENVMELYFEVTVLCGEVEYIQRGHNNVFLSLFLFEWRMVAFCLPVSKTSACFPFFIIPVFKTRH